MSKIKKIIEVDGTPIDIPSGVAYAWDMSASPPKIWYRNASGDIVEWTTSGGVSNPLTSNLNAAGNKIFNGANPTASQDYVTLSYFNSNKNGVDTSPTNGSVFATADWSAQEVSYQYMGNVLYMRDVLTNTTGYTGGVITNTTQSLPSNMTPSVDTPLAITYYDHSASLYLPCVLIIKDDGTLEYEPPTGVTPAVDDIIYLYKTYLQ